MLYNFDVRRTAKHMFCNFNGSATEQERKLLNENLNLIASSKIL